jgi:hypothetical protein
MSSRLYARYSIEFSEAALVVIDSFPGDRNTKIVQESRQALLGQGGEGAEVLFMWGGKSRPDTQGTYELYLAKTLRNQFVLGAEPYPAQDAVRDLVTESFWQRFPRYEGEYSVWFNDGMITVKEWRAHPGDPYHADYVGGWAVNLGGPLPSVGA